MQKFQGIIFIWIRTYREISNIHRKADKSQKSVNASYDYEQNHKIIQLNQLHKYAILVCFVKENY